MRRMIRVLALSLVAFSGLAAQGSPPPRKSTSPTVRIPIVKEPVLVRVDTVWHRDTLRIDLPREILRVDTLWRTDTLWRDQPVIGPSHKKRNILIGVGAAALASCPVYILFTHKMCVRNTNTTIIHPPK